MLYLLQVFIGDVSTSGLFNVYLNAAHSETLSPVHTQQLI